MSKDDRSGEAAIPMQFHRRLAECLSDDSDTDEMEARSRWQRHEQEESERRSRQELPPPMRVAPDGETYTEDDFAKYFNDDGAAWRRAERFDSDGDSDCGFDFADSSGLVAAVYADSEFLWDSGDDAPSTREAWLAPVCRRRATAASAGAACSMDTRLPWSRSACTSQ